MSQRALASVTQAQFMVGIYGEIVAMDLVILERVRNLILNGPDDNDGAYRAHMRLVLGQLDKVSDRISYWSGELRDLVEAELL